MDVSHPARPRRRALLLVGLGILLGLVSAAWSIHRAIVQGDLRVGPWHAFNDPGDTTRDALHHTAVAVGTLLALRHAEAVYFEADTDESGQTLDGRCTYELTGNDLPARWWSVTLYGGDRFLIRNPFNRWSFTGSNLLHASDGTWRVIVSPTPHGQNWIPTGNARRLVVILRMFSPPANVVGDPSLARLPSLVRRGCP